MRSFWIFLRKKSDRREKVMLSFGGNRKSIALSVLGIFAFKLCENRYVCVCCARWGDIPKFGSYGINLTSLSGKFVFYIEFSTRK